MYRLSIDTGGTFTDFTAVDDAGVLVQAKVPSSRDVNAFMHQGLEALSRSLELPVRDFLRQVDLLIHGTTVPLNTLLQAEGPVLGLVCTEGFRDTLEVRLGYREKRYDFTYLTPAPLVPRFLRLPVRERIDKNGEVVSPLHQEDVAGARGNICEAWGRRRRRLSALVVSQPRARTPGTAPFAGATARGARLALIRRLSRDPGVRAS